MPGRVKVRILNARDLPIMDRASELTDAFVEVRFGPDTFKTEVCKKSLNPQWNSEWFKFEADDEVLQDEPLDIKVLDYDTYSSHDTIGKVYIDLNPLLSRESPNTISGWFPIYDTMHGLRGELNIQVRVELFTDFNKFRHSSCGIQLFGSCEVPSGWCITAMLGFIEELVVNDDPEHQWIEKIRTPRASNEARQRIFSKLSGTLQRKLGVKVLEMGGNAVLGYFQNFDLEGESGIVVRAIGTAVSLSRIQVGQPSPAPAPPSSVSPGKESWRNSMPLFLYHHNLLNYKTPQQHQQKQRSTPRFTRQVSSPDSTTECPLYNSAGVGDSGSIGSSTCSVVVSENQNHTSWHQPSPPSTAPLLASESQLSNQSAFPFSSSPSLPEVWPANTNSSSAVIGSSNSMELAISGQAPSSAPQPGATKSLGQTTPESTFPTPVSVSNVVVDNVEAASSSEVPGTTANQQQPEPLQAARQSSISPVRVTPEGEGRTRRVSESEVNSPPRAGNLSGTPVTIPSRVNFIKSSMFQQSIDLLEYPFFTMRTFPPGFIMSLGGVVSARSVKLLDKIHNPEEPQTRDAWWSELRTEIKSHAMKLGCHAVLGYIEYTTICDEVIVLSASGTAAKIDLAQQEALLLSTLTSGSTVPHPTGGAVTTTSGGSSVSPSAGTGSSVVADKEVKDKHLFVDIGLANQGLQRTLGGSQEKSDEGPGGKCSLCHIPYCPSNLPFEIQLSKCAICRKHNVPDVLFTTVDPPPEIPVWSKGCLIQARICRGRSNKIKSSEQSAREVSDILPFIEYEVHNQLINKLKIRGLNCLFGLKIQIVLGDNMIVAIGTATGTYLGPLPSPPQPVISTEVATADESQDLVTLQHRITRTVQMHRERLNSEIVERQGEHSPLSRPPTDDETDDDEGDEGNFFLEKTKDKNTFVLMIDDVKDESVSLMLHDIIPPEGFDICNTQTLPGLTADKIAANLQMFTQMVTVKYQPHLHNSLDFSNIFNAILRRLCFKMRHLRPCCICDLSFHVDLPDEDEINVTVTGCCLGLFDSTGDSYPSETRMVDGKAPEMHTGNPSEDLIFPLEGVGPDHGGGGSHARHGSVSSQAHKVLTRQSKIIPQKSKLLSKGIELTPLNKICNGKIERYMGYYNFFFIRESTAVKEGGGIGGFLQSFILEVKAIVRAHVSALGGNALVAYNMSQCVLDDNPHRNQGQCLINVSGDVVVVIYDEEDRDVAFVDTPITLSSV